MSTPLERPRAVKVWDPFVRVFHWSLVACVLLNQFVLEAGETPHQWAGYIASGLVVQRVGNYAPTASELTAAIRGEAGGKR